MSCATNTSIDRWSIELDQFVSRQLFVVVGIVSSLVIQALLQGVNCVQFLFSRLNSVSDESKLSLSGIVSLFLVPFLLGAMQVGQSMMIKSITAVLFFGLWRGLCNWSTRRLNLDWRGPCKGYRLSFFLEPPLRNVYSLTWRYKSYGWECHGEDKLWLDHSNCTERFYLLI